MSTHNTFLWRYKKNIMLISPLICSYDSADTIIPYCTLLILQFDWVYLVIHLKSVG